MNNDTTNILSDLRLRFNIENPSYEETYLFGYECALKACLEEDNPYAKGTPEFDHWLEGWWAGFYEEPCLFDKGFDDALLSDKPANDESFVSKHSLITLAVEIGGAIAASAFIGYQLLELVA